MARKKLESNLPTYDELIIPTVKALIELGGSGSIEEINRKVYEITSLTDEILQIPHSENSNQTEIDYRLAWSRTYLRIYGLLENSSRGVWVLSKSNIDLDKLDYKEIIKTVKEQDKLQKSKPKAAKSIEEVSKIVAAEVNENFEDWKENLLKTLYNITPSAFERLAQRILRESGFFQVEVTGKVGDGGIDGKGILRVSGLISFPVLFQCKRYKGSVTPSQIRDFRGAMLGRTDIGLFITTGTFTREAVKEAQRDGAPLIDLIDGESLCEKLKELKLGVETKLIESVEINNNWFDNL